MKNIISVSSSDAVNLYGFKISVEALVKATFDSCLFGIPCLYGHDSSKLIGWAYPRSVYFEPGLSRTAENIFIPETDEELSHLEKIQDYYYDEKLYKPNLSSINKLEAKLSSVLRGEQKVIISDSISLYEEGIAERKFPEIFLLKDEDGLIPLSSLNAVGFGIYKVGELLLYANRFFRRSYYLGNILNYQFLHRIQALDSDDSKVKISIDPHLVGLAETFTSEKKELQYWWGPKFDNNLTRIPSGVSRYEADENQKLSSDISRTEFRWGSVNQDKVFEVEELRDQPNNTENSEEYGCRYAHSIINPDTGEIKHLDGAIRMYSEEKMLKRLEADISKAPRDTEYKKLWRVDGTIETADWKSLLSDYFRDNSLVGEYFSGEDKKMQDIKRMKSTRKKSIREKYIPYSFIHGSGIRVALSFEILKEEQKRENPSEIPFDYISDGKSSKPFVETIFLEIKKLMQKEGIDIELPQGTEFVTFKDEYFNLPLVYFHVDVENNIICFTKAIKKLVIELKKRFNDSVISYKIGFPVSEDRAAIISVLGGIEEIEQWLNSKLHIPPFSRDELCKWAFEVSSYLEQYSSEIDKPPLTEVLMPTGLLVINRKRMETEDFEVRYSEELENFQFSGILNVEDTNNKDELIKEGIAPSIGYLIKKSTCSKCKNEYKNCNCSKFFGKDVHVLIQEAIPFPFWTDQSSL